MTDEQMPNAGDGPVERSVGRLAPKRATPGQAAYEAMHCLHGGEPWAVLARRWPASANDWESVASAVLLHAADQLPVPQRVAALLRDLRKTFVKIGEHRYSVWDTTEELAAIDRLLSDDGKTPNVRASRPA